MRPIALTLTLTLTLAATAQAQNKPAKASADPDRSVAGGGSLPRGWSARTDAKGKEADIRFVVMDPGWHVTLGPPALLWRATDKAEAGFTATALLSQTTAPKHPEGYGIFVGGQSLEADPQQKYTYFLIRGDGKYLIKKRDGANVTNLISAWTPHPAIVKQGPTGEATNRLEVTMDNTRLVFRVNGKEVYSADPRLIDTKGIAGLRVNHNLDLHVQSFDVKKL
ncbi:MAG: hypothetical protein ACREOC_00630 [Gemmatimonadales bacterium]